MVYILNGEKKKPICLNNQPNNRWRKCLFFLATFHSNNGTFKSIGHIYWLTNNTCFHFHLFANTFDACIGCWTLIFTSESHMFTTYSNVSKTEFRRGKAHTKKKTKTIYPNNNNNASTKAIGKQNSQLLDEWEEKTSDAETMYTLRTISRMCVIKRHTAIIWSTAE